MTLEQIQTRITKLTRVNLKIAEYLRVCDITHRAVDGSPCEDPRCKAIARKYEENEEEILSLLDLKYEYLGGNSNNVIDRLLSL